MKPEKTGARQGSRNAGGRFKPGTSGNPSGRPKGALNRSSRVAAAFLQGEAEALARKAVELALAGDVTALRVCLERLLPPARERAIEARLPRVVEAADLPLAVGRVLELVCDGEITPSEGTKLAELLGGWRAALELSEIEARLAVLEGRR